MVHLLIIYLARESHRAGNCHFLGENIYQLSAWHVRSGMWRAPIRYGDRLVLRKIQYLAWAHQISSVWHSDKQRLLYITCGEEMSNTSMVFFLSQFTRMFGWRWPRLFVLWSQTICTLACLFAESELDILLFPEGQSFTSAFASVMMCMHQFTDVEKPCTSQTHLGGCWFTFIVTREKTGS